MGVVNFLFTGSAYLSNARANRRVASPNINTIGYSAMTLSFNFIGNGSGDIDKGYFQYSTDGGATWVTPTAPPSSTTPALPAGSSFSNMKSQMCSPQGRWTNVTWVLPPECEGIPNLRLAFVWQNNNLTAGATDPALAIDDVVISVLLAPVRLTAFDATCAGDQLLLSWTTANEENCHHYTIYSSSDLLTWKELATVAGAGTTQQVSHYQLPLKAYNDWVYFRLAQTDDDGTTSVLRTIACQPCSAVDFTLQIFPNPTTGSFRLVSSPINSMEAVHLYDCSGRLVFQTSLDNILPVMIVDLPEFIPDGTYVLRVLAGSASYYERIVIQHQ